jgi:glycolate oxidase iron-sulfur subunit
VRGIGVAGQPRRLLTGIPGVDVVEMERPARCCGGAGSFSITHPELSVAIGERKAEDIAATRSELVATACPGCKMQLADSLCRAAERPVVHVVELLDLAAHGADA